MRGDGRFSQRWSHIVEWVKHHDGTSAAYNCQALSCIGNQLLGVGMLPNSQMLDKACRDLGGQQ